MDCTGFDTNNVKTTTGITPACAFTAITPAQSPYTATTADEVVSCNAGSATITVNLANDVTRIRVMKADISTFPVIIVPPPGKTISSAASFSLGRQNEICELCLCEGCSDYKIINDGLGRLLTTRGDIYARDNTRVIRLPVGANNQVLTALSSTGSGLTWTTPLPDQFINNTVDPTPRITLAGFVPIVIDSTTYYVQLWLT